jgi:hypothetical protein
MQNTVFLGNVFYWILMKVLKSLPWIKYTIENKHSRRCRFFEWSLDDLKWNWTLGLERFTQKNVYNHNQSSKEIDGVCDKYARTRFKICNDC